MMSLGSIGQQGLLVQQGLINPRGSMSSSRWIGSMDLTMRQLGLIGPPNSIVSNPKNQKTLAAFSFLCMLSSDIFAKLL